MEFITNCLMLCVVRCSIQRGSQAEAVLRRKRVNGSIIDRHNVHTLDDKKDIFYPLSFVMHNTKPVGHQVLCMVS